MLREPPVIPNIVKNCLLVGFPTPNSLTVIQHLVFIDGQYSDNENSQ